MPSSTLQKNEVFDYGFLQYIQQIRKKLQIRSHLMKKSVIENFIFCAVQILSQLTISGLFAYKLTKHLVVVSFSRSSSLIGRQLASAGTT